MKGILITFLSVLAIAGGIMLQQSQRIFAVAPEAASTAQELKKLIDDKQVTIDEDLLRKAIDGSPEALRYVAFCYEEGLEGVKSASDKAYKYKTQTEGTPLGEQLSEKLKVSRAKKNTQLDKFKGIVPDDILDKAKAVATDDGWRNVDNRSALHSIVFACGLEYCKRPDGMSQEYISRLCEMEYLTGAPAEDRQREEVMYNKAKSFAEQIRQHQERKKTIAAEEEQIRQGILQSLHLGIVNASTLESLCDFEGKIIKSGLSELDQDLLFVELNNQRDAIKLLEEAEKKKAAEEAKKNAEEEAKKKFMSKITKIAKSDQIGSLYGEIMQDGSLSVGAKEQLLMLLGGKQEALTTKEDGQRKEQRLGNAMMSIVEAQSFGVERIPEIAVIPLQRNGIHNVGNSCFLNSVIQQLYRAPDFRQHLMNLRNPGSIMALKGGRDNNFVIYYNLMQIFHVLDQADPDKPVNIESFVDAIRVMLYVLGGDEDNVFRQQDAEDFMGRICVRVGFNLSIRTVQGGDPMHCAVNVANVGEGKSLLNALVSSFGLSAQNKFRVSLPQTMMITLQRFISQENGQTAKLRKKISLDDEIDLAEHCMDEITGSKRYRLVGIVVHRGQTAFGGHYVSYVRDGEQWYLLNDATVTPVVGNIDDIEELKTDAYILKYERIG